MVLTVRLWTALPIDDAGYGIKRAFGEDNASRYLFHFEAGQFASTHAAQDAIVFAVRHLVLLCDSPKASGIHAALTQKCGRKYTTQIWMRREQRKGVSICRNQFSSC